MHSECIGSTLDAYSISGLYKRVRNYKIFLISQPKCYYYVVGTQKNRPNETVLLSTQNKC